MAKHERAHEMFFLNRLKPEGRVPNEKFAPNATACSPEAPAKMSASRPLLLQ